MSAQHVLGEVQDILRDREDDYDDYNDMLKTIADYWNTYLRDVLHSEEDGMEVVLGPEDVAQMMALFKIARASVGYGAKTSDDLKDSIGYMAMASDIMERTEALLDEEEGEDESFPVTQWRVDHSSDWDAAERSFEDMIRNFTGEEGKFAVGWVVNESE